MKKTTRNILATLAVAVVLGGAATALLLTQPDTGEDSSSVSSSASSDTSISLYSYENNEIESISVSNANGGYKLLARTETASTSSSDTSSGEEQQTTTFYVDGVDDAYQNVSTVSTAASYATALSATSEIGNADELKLEDYGLKDPVATITTTLTDGDEVSYSIGNDSPVTGTYILYDNTVYAASVGTYFDKSKLDFVLTTILTITPPEDSDNSSSDSSSTADTNEYTQFVFTGSNFPEEVKVVPETALTSSFEIVSPYEVSTNPTTFDTLTANIESLTATSVAAVDPTDEQLEEFGLKNPTVQMKVSVNGNSYTLLSGKLNGSDRYVMLKGVDVVYVCSEDSVSSWANATLFSLRDSFVWLQDITKVNKVTLKTPDRTEVFSLTRTENEESSTEDKVVYDYSVKGTDGQDITYSGVFTTYYQTLIGVQLLDETTETESTGDLKLSVTYDFYDGGESRVINYYSIGGRRCLVEVNGQVVGVVSESVIQEIIANLDTVLDNQSIDGNS